MVREIWVRLTVVTVTILLFSITLLPVHAQTDAGTITGAVTDPSGAAIPNATLHLVNTNTGTQRIVKTNHSGLYVIPSVSPGSYKLRAEHVGFKRSDLVGITVHVQDNILENIHLQLGAVSETVTVNASDENINTTNGAVGTVIDRQFVNNIPMNGRSFQTLIELAPGVITNSPTNTGDIGEYVVNGQRADSNGFQVDGASASNTALITTQSSPGNSGSLPSATVLGTTHAMIQIDAMEEFRITTSSYSAEFGNHPGAQVSFRSRSGTNSLHGDIFEYLRNSAFDANNWFNTNSTPIVPTPPERQNDFGGSLGGPLSIPHVFSGRNRAFFFFSYEGLRLVNPLGSSIYDVPSNGTHVTANYSANPEWANLRKYAPASFQSFVNAWPLPNCDTTIDPQCVDYGEGSTAYRSSAPSASKLNSLSARVDYQLTSGMRVFARYADTLSYGSTVSQSGPYVSNTEGRTRVFLLGVDNTFGPAFSNELRLQYSPVVLSVSDSPIQTGGAGPFNLYTIQGLPLGGYTYLRYYSPNTSNIYQVDSGSQQFQPNITEALTWVHGNHLVKVGGSYVQTTAYYGKLPLSTSPDVAYHEESATAILAGVLTNATSSNFGRVDPTVKQLGLFIQDEWRVIPRLSLSLGLRWDLAPAPSISGQKLYTYTGNINIPSSLGISAPGAPLYLTDYKDFAPRFGAAYVVHTGTSHETVLRAGAGLFNETISLNRVYGGASGQLTVGGQEYKNTPFLTASQILLPPQPVLPPYDFNQYPTNNIVPPYAMEWNLALEQSLGRKQTLTMGYVGSVGRKLLNYQVYSLTKLNPTFGTFQLYENGPSSSYNSLQVKFQRKMARGLQAIASYTWAHSIDWSSNEGWESEIPLERGDSDHDVRHVFSAALVYHVPAPGKNRLVKSTLGDWTADLLTRARSPFPYQPTGVETLDTITGEEIYSRLNWNGVIPYIYQKGLPGGRQVNPADFSIVNNPLTDPGTLPRNYLRAFGELQFNLAIQRDFPIGRGAKLQFRASAFNLFNHPSFGAIETACGAVSDGEVCDSTIMGQASGTLNAGLGGLNSLYQQGGPRSLQFALKALF